MSKDPMLATLSRRQRVWDISLCAMLIGGAIACVISLPKVMDADNLSDSILYIILFGIPAIGIMLQVLKSVDSMVRRYMFKSYYIEDCGDVVKLYGSIPCKNLDQAYKELLRHRHGFKIEHEAFTKFGCTLAAVKASKNELDSASELRRYGINIATIN